MGQVLVVTSGKANVGKTVTTANLGTALAQLGKKVCLVDADIGLRNLDVVMGLENRVVYDLVNVIEGDAKLKQALIKDKRQENLYLLPAAQTRNPNDVKPDQMKWLAKQLAQDFDFVILDCPAGIEHGFVNAITAADRALVVVNPEVSSVRDADRVIGLWEAQKDRNEKNAAMLVITDFRPAMVEKGDMLDVSDIMEMLAVDLLGVVPEDEKILVSSNKGEPVVYLAGSVAGLAYKNIARRLLGEQVPLLNFVCEDTLWQRIWRLLGVSRNGIGKPSMITGEVDRIRNWVENGNTVYYLTLTQGPREIYRVGWQVGSPSLCVTKEGDPVEMWIKRTTSGVEVASFRNTVLDG